jgi:hypothetical protein
MDAQHFGYRNRKKQAREKIKIKIKIRMVSVLKNRLEYFWVFMVWAFI